MNIHNKCSPSGALAFIIIMSEDDNYGVEDRGHDSELDEENIEESSINSLDSKDSDKESMEEEEEQGGMEEQEKEDRVDVITQPVFEVANTIKITPPFLTKYEKARVIGVRATQISKNSPLYLNADDKDLSHWDPLYIAEKELSEKVIPFIIRRYLPDSSFEDWKLADLRMLE